MSKKNFYTKCFFSFTAILFLVVFVKLGFWQLERLKFKHSLKHNIQESFNSKVQDISLLSYEELESIPLYSKIAINAKIIEEDVFLYGARYGFRAPQDGKYICNVIQNKLGIRFLINRGWINKNTKLKRSLGKMQYFQAIVMPYEKHNMFIPQNTSKILFTLNKKDSQSLLDVSLNSYYLLAISDTSSQIQHLELSQIVLFKDNHLEYAISWFLFAIVTVIIYLYTMFYRKSE